MLSAILLDALSLVYSHTNSDRSSWEVLEMSFNKHYTYPMGH